MEINFPEPFLYNLYIEYSTFFNFISILILGYLGGILVKYTILKLFRITGLHNMIKFSKIQMVFEEIGYRGTVLSLIADIAKWFVYILALSSAFEIIGFTELSHLFSSIVLFFPNMIISVIIIIIGVFIADLFGKIIFDLISGKDMTGEFSSLAMITSSFARIMFYIITIIMALNILGLDSSSITVFMAFLLLTTSALFILSMKDLAPNFMAGIYMKNVGLKEKDKVIVGKVSGSIVKISVFNTTLQVGKKTVAIPNSSFIKYGFEK